MEWIDGMTKKRSNGIDRKQSNYDCKKSNPIFFAEKWLEAR